MEAELHDGTVLEFPDGTDPKVVQATVQRVLQSRSGAPQAPSGAAGAPQAGGRAHWAGASALEPSTLLRNTVGTVGDMLRLTTGNLLANKADLQGAKTGVANSGLHAGLGVKSLVNGPLDSEDKSVLRESDADVQRMGGAATAGKAVGDAGRAVAEGYLLPGRKLKFFANTGKSMLQSGLDTFLTDDSDKMSDRVTQAEKSAALGGLVNAGVSGAGKLATGAFKYTKDALDLFRQDINPTLQQGGQNPIVKWVGGLTSGFSDIKTRQAQELAGAVSDRISGGNVRYPADATMGERLSSLSGGLDADTTRIVGNKRFPMSDTTRNMMVDAGNNIELSGGRFFKQSKKAVDDLMNIVGTDSNTVRMGYPKLKGDYIDPLDNLLGSTKEPRVLQGLQNAKDILIARSRNAPLSPDEIAAFKEIDKRMYDLQRLKEATGPDLQVSGVPPKRLSDAYGNGPQAGMTDTEQELIGPLRRTIGNTPRQDEARTMMSLVKRTVPLAGASVVSGGAGALAVSPLYALSALGQTAGGSRFLAGQNPWQQKLLDSLNDPYATAARQALMGIGSPLTGH